MNRLVLLGVRFCSRRRTYQPSCSVLCSNGNLAARAEYELAVPAVVLLKEQVLPVTLVPQSKWRWEICRYCSAAFTIPSSAFGKQLAFLVGARA